MDSEPTYYELLGVEPEASYEEIKSAFRKQALRMHPDQGGSAGFFRLLERAYGVLVDPNLRAQYDERIGNPEQTQEQEDSYSGETTPPDGYRFDDFYEENDTTNVWEGPFPHEPVEEAPNSGPEIGGGHRPHVAMAVKIAAAVVILIFIAIELENGTFGVESLFWVALLLGFLWLAGSWILRLSGWLSLAWAVFEAHWGSASGWVTFTRVLLAVALWLGGHWFFAFRHGHWRSLIARSFVGKLPYNMRPDRRWGQQIT